MEEAQKRNIVKDLGMAFRSLPSDRDRLDILAALTGIMKSRFRDDDLLEDWLAQAESCLKSSVMIMDTKTVSKTKEEK
jgi:hypothetical protein